MHALHIAKTPQRVVIVIALLAFAAFIWWLRDLILLIFGAVLVAVIFRALADPIHRRLGLSHAVSLALTVLILAVLAVMVAVFFGGEIIAQGRTLGDTLPAAWTAFQDRIDDSSIGRRLVTWAQTTEPDNGGVMSSVSRIVGSFTSGVVDLTLVIIGGIYLAAQPLLYRDGMLLLLPADARALLQEAFGDSARALKLWLSGQLLSMAAVGAMASLGLWFLNVPAALGLGLIAGLLDFVPFVGPFLAAVPALLLALTVGPTTALYVGILYVVIQQIEGNVIQPIVQQRKVDLPPALLVFSLVGIGTMFGTMGVILAAPLTVVAFVMVKLLYVRVGLGTATTVPGEVGGGVGQVRTSSEAPALAVGRSPSIEVRAELAAVLTSPSEGLP